MGLANSPAGQYNGNFVRVLHPNGYESSYIHLSQPPVVTEGDYVFPGTVLGLVGHTGDTTDNHLHLQIKTPVGIPIDPLTILHPGCG